MIKLSLPFYKNPVYSEATGEGVQCAQVAMKIVLEYFLDKQYTLEQLDKLTGRSGNFGTNTFQVVASLHDLGLEVYFYSKESVRCYLDKKTLKDRWHELYKEEVKTLYERANILAIVKSARKIIKYNLFENKILPFEEIENHIRKGHVPIMAITRGDGSVLSHLVVMAGFDGDYVTYHESGPYGAQPDKPESKKIFIKKWSDKGTDNDVVIVYGKRKLKLIEKLANLV